MTTNDEHQKILALRTAAKSPDAEDPRWEALADGRLSEKEVDELREAALQTDEGKALWELYRPLDHAEKDRLFEGVRGRIRADRARSWRRQNGIRFGVPAIGAVAAAMMLYFQNPPVPALISPTLGASPEAPVLTFDEPDKPAEIPIMPVEPLQKPLTLRGSLLVKDGVPHTWAPAENNLKLSPENVLYLTGTRREMFPCLGPGDWQLRLAVGPEGRRVSKADLLDDSSKKVVRGTVRLEGPAVAPPGKPCSEIVP